MIEKKYGENYKGLISMVYGILFELVTEEWSVTCDMVALLHTYYHHGYTKDSIYTYEHYYDEYVDDVVNVISKLVEKKYGLDMNDEDEEDEFVDLFKKHLKEWYWVDSMAHGVGYHYLDCVDKPYLKDINLISPKGDWIREMFDKECENNNDFKDFVEVFD